MACGSPQELPQAFRPIPQFESVEARQEISNLTQKIAENRTVYSFLPAPYRAKSGTRSVVIAVIVAAVVVAILSANGSLLAFPDKFLNFIHTINWTYAGMGSVICTILIGGVAVVIRRASYYEDQLTQTDMGRFKGEDHWIPAVYESEKTKGDFYPGFIDTSTLNEEGTGTAFMYAYKDEQNTMSVNLAVFSFSSLHMIGAIAYNAIRLLIIPFFILGCMLVEKASNTAIDPDDRPYRLSDIPQEMAKSMWRMVKAPFYCVAMMFAALFAFIDPLNGRKLGATVERDWNEGVTRAEGFWSVRCAQPLWQFEGGRSPSHLGKNGFYLAGCWQPIAVAYYEKGEIARGVSLSRAVNPTKGMTYTILTSDFFIQKHNELVDTLDQIASANV
jgi:hypothetical protein